MKTDKQRKVGIFLFNEVEVLDFAGPYEVFSVAKHESAKLFDVFTVAQRPDAISARNGLKVIPDYTFENHPEADILIVPGGYGAEHIENNNPVVLQWIANQFSKLEILASVCTGAFLLASAGLLNGKKVTTHWLDYERLENEFPELEVVRDVKFVDQGKLLTAGGISAGIDMCFHIISRLHGRDIAFETARFMAYDYKHPV